MYKFGKLISKSIRVYAVRMCSFCHDWRCEMDWNIAILIIDRVAGEIICFVASMWVCVCVHPFVWKIAHYVENFTEVTSVTFIRGRDCYTLQRSVVGVYFLTIC